MNVAKWVNNSELSLLPRIEGRRQAGGAGKGEFCRSHLCRARWAADRRSPRLLSWGCRGGGRDLGARAGAGAKPSLQIRRGDRKGRARGLGAQRFPAREERGSHGPAGVPARALALRSGSSVLCAPTDNGWQLPALGTKVRPASPSTQPGAFQTPSFAPGRSGLALGVPGSARGSREGDGGLRTGNEVRPRLCEQVLGDRGPCQLPRGTRGWARPVRGSGTGRGHPTPLAPGAGVCSAPRSPGPTVRACSLESVRDCWGGGFQGREGTGLGQSTPFPAPLDPA